MNIQKLSNNAKEYYIGLLSGTSIDAIDVGLFEINNKSQTIKTLNTLNYAIPLNLKNNLNQIIINKNTSLQNIGELDRKLGIVFANAVSELLKHANIPHHDITAIGFHGQTIFHHPQKPYNFTIQLGDPNTIIETVKIPVVTDFRQRDIVNGGQGAPLAPLFHRQFFYSNNNNRAIINIGGISNITLLAKDANITNEHYIASDLGPGNTLLDQWFCKHHPNSAHQYDQDGHYAKSGTVNLNLLNKMLQDNYFSQSWPKSTGREYFNLNWLDQYLQENNSISPLDIQRTLLELTAQIIATNVLKNSSDLQINEVYICGGGAYNTFLLQRISELLNPITVNTTDKLGIEANWVEAATFAWLAACTWHKKTLNLKYITGNVNSASILGCLYY
jgi:anhydro-N-acetylmuramic acid kinase